MFRWIAKNPKRRPSINFKFWFSCIPHKDAAGSVFLTEGKRAFFGLTLTAFFFVMNPSAVFSLDKVVLKSGKIVEGTIEERNDRFIQLNVGLNFPITYYNDDVKEIILEQKHSSFNEVLSLNGSVDQQADNLEQKGLSLIDEDKMEEGLTLLRKAVAMNPKADRHLNLGAILSGNGVSLFKKDRKKEAEAVFKESERELQQAIKLFNPKTESIFLSQAYFLLGELYAQGLNNKIQAREFYEKSNSLYPNPSAERGLNALKP